MKNHKLVNLQWQYMRNSVWISLLTGVFIVFVLTYGEQQGFAVLFQKKLLGTPLFLLIPFVCISIGSIFGYLIGNGVKKRLEQLTEGTMAYERGNFAHRISELGHDEIGVMGQRMNTMATRIEEQVASLQRLSAERSRWQETIKQTAVSEERQRLARDLHDAVSQQLFAISMMTAALKTTLKKDPVKGEKQIELVETMAATAQSEMRALLLHLRPTHLEGKKLKQGIEELLTELKSKNELAITWKIDELTDHIAKGIEDHLFRIVQEGLSNILRHAKAKKVELQLRESNEQIRLKIIDNGVGFDTSTKKTGSYGLQTMRERVYEVGGVFEIVSIKGKGTQIEAVIPIVKERA
ncbi:HAMP domain-containing sensor histidine kinase [Bacillus sp. FJAT-45350]|uniref:HAMP domain-containing sensor histidine kinase n=1 Tax=Bacillus sp. FJAT-45350 TaxID=2011014 RepID=UPI000BB92FB7|nr:sensor histidine kinase [Bacillus sp. FJAT-45350]